MTSERDSGAHPRRCWCDGCPEHRHSGPCERWLIPPVAWRDNVQETILLGSRRPLRVVRVHRPTGAAVCVEGDEVYAARELCTAELNRLLDEMEAQRG